MNTIVVDCHKEILPYWFKEYLKFQRPLVVIRIDEHHDMSHECPVLPASEGRPILRYIMNLMPYIIEYSKIEINEANFTCPAFHYGIIGSLYHFNPRVEEIDAYGRISSHDFVKAPKTRIEAVVVGGMRRDRIVWDKAHTKLRIKGGKPIPIPQSLTIDELRRDLADCRYPVAIGFDLDGLYGIQDKSPAERVIAERLQRTRKVLECVPSPSFACIARSQTPRRYVPREIVDDLQKDAVNLIQDIYN